MSQAQPLAVLCTPATVAECDLARLTGALYGSRPVPGFGASDCSCPTHLYLLSDYEGVQGLVADLQRAASENGEQLPVLCVWELCRDEGASNQK